MQNRPEIEFGEQKITLAVRKTQRVLPFSVKLIDFEKIAYAGTSMAREYQSIVEIDEGSGIRWQAMIRMNEPLRVMGYTLYQSSFVERSGETISVLAVVKNKGRVFPYVASLVIGIGLLVHLRMRRKKVRA
jgi:cytochrome c biogenesis protein ResB